MAHPCGDPNRATQCRAWSVASNSRRIRDVAPKSRYTPPQMGRPHSADKKFVRARGPQNWNPEVFDQTRCSRILHVEFPLNNRELVKAEVFEKRVFEQTTPFKLRKWRGHFPWTTALVGTVRPPDQIKVSHLSPDPPIALSSHSQQAGGQGGCRGGRWRALRHFWVLKTDCAAEGCRSYSLGHQSRYSVPLSACPI